MEKVTPGWFLVMFFVLGWSYYMVATILMRGSLFEPMRNAIYRRADSNRFYWYMRNMLGCMMCTATEAALWTLGPTTFGLGVWYHLPETVVGAITRQTVDLSTPIEWALMAMISFAFSLAVSGEAWAIKTVSEFNETKFVELESEYKQREIELWNKIHELETGTTRNDEYEFDLT